MKKLLTLIAFAFTFSILPTTDLDAQCPMCRMSAESNLKEGGSDGKGLNKGILYMLAAPYLFAGVLGFAYFRYQKHTKEEQRLQELMQLNEGQLN